VTLVYCGQRVGWIKMKFGMEVGLGPGHIVLDGDPAPPAPKGHSCPIFGPCLMPLGMEKGLSPGDILVDGDPAPPPKKGTEPPPIFDPCLLWPNGWIDKDATWYTCRHRPRTHCARWEPSSPEKGGTALPNVRPMSIVAKRSPISATAEHLPNW